MSSPSSRAKPDRPPAESTVEQRVKYIADLMTCGDYHSYATRMDLGKAWGVSDSTVRGYSAEAHRLVVGDPEERERLRTAQAYRVRAIGEAATIERDEKTGLPDRRTALMAIELESKLMGIELDSRKVELTGKGGGPVAVTLDDIDSALVAADKNDAGSKEPDDGDGGS